MSLKHPILPNHDIKHPVVDDQLPVVEDQLPKHVSILPPAGMHRQHYPLMHHLLEENFQALDLHQGYETPLLTVPIVWLLS